MAPDDVASRMVVFAAHGMLAPVVAFREPMPYVDCPLSDVNDPPTMTRLRSGASTIDHTCPLSTVGAHGRRAPVEVLTALRLLRATPFTAP